jgi:hypothetical protein
VWLPRQVPPARAVALTLLLGASASAGCGDCGRASPTHARRDAAAACPLPLEAFCAPQMLHSWREADGVPCAPTYDAVLANMRRAPHRDELELRMLGADGATPRPSTGVVARAGWCGPHRYVEESTGYVGHTLYFDASGALTGAITASDDATRACTSYGEIPDCVGRIELDLVDDAALWR